MTLKNYKYKIENVSLLCILLILFVIPMTHFDILSYLLHDSRWWSNQYLEFYNTFPHSMPVSFSAYNNSGLAITTFYPNTFLKLLEIPLVLLKIKNLYIVMGTLTIMIYIINLLFIYMNTRLLNKKRPFQIAIIVQILTCIPLIGGLNNSLPQQLATAFIFLGVYGIISKKYEYFMISTIVILHTSFTTAIVAAIVYAILLIITKESISGWINTFFAGTLGIAASMPMLINVFKNIHSIQGPTQLFNDTSAPWTIIGYLSHPNSQIIITYLTRTIIPLIILVAMYMTYTKYTSKVTPYLLIILTIIAASPRLSIILSSPIQPGTWSRIYPLILVLSMISFSNINFEKYSHVLPIIGISGLILIASTLHMFVPLSHQNTPYMNAFRSNNWSNVYRYANIQLKISDNHNRVLIASEPSPIADLSPDYIPKKATLKDNHIAYQPPMVWKSKYGLEKHSINNGKTLKITIDPKHNVTPLGVWHYDFLKYNVSSTNGKVVVSNHDMFEYHGTKKTTIFISLK